MDYDILLHPVFLWSLAAFLVFQLALFHGIMHNYPKQFQTTSQSAWIITTASSVVMTVGSLPFLYQYWMEDSDLRNVSLLNSHLAVILCAYFMSYLLADMYFGYYHYSDQMSPVTGWFHHIAYMIIIPVCMVNKVPGAFMVVGFMEFPTVILAIGYMFPPYKNEILFGFTFFWTRIVFHIHYASAVALAFPQKRFFFLATCTIPLHFYWFFRWAKRQYRRLADELHQRILNFYPPIFPDITIPSHTKNKFAVSKKTGRPRKSTGKVSSNKK
jgi:hypothetical protein